MAKVDQIFEEMYAKAGISMLPVPDEEGVRRKVSESKLKLITGGKSPTNGNWLADMEEGSFFVCLDAKDQSNFACLQMELVAKTERTAILYLIKDLESHIPFGEVDQVRFTNRFSLVYSKGPEKEPQTNEE